MNDSTTTLSIADQIDFINKHKIQGDIAAIVKEHGPKGSAMYDILKGRYPKINRVHWEPIRLLYLRCKENADRGALATSKTKVQ